MPETAPPSPLPAPLAPRKRGSRWANAGIVLLSLVVTLAVLELAFRLVAGVPVFSAANWRLDRVLASRLSDHAQFDPMLGWTLKPNHEGLYDHRTLDHGIRANGTEIALRTGGILAVGDSFTQGWEVDDEESWPAYLEGLVGRPVINGGVGGYGTDQIVLRAEQLLPIVKPKILIVGIFDLDIFRSGHSLLGAPKPHFTLENGALRFHPPAPFERRPPDSALAAAGIGLRAAMGYSALADYLFGRLTPGFWYSADLRAHAVPVAIDVVAVTCALLDRLKQRTAAEGIRTLLFMQHSAPLVVSDQMSDNARRVMTCAAASGIEVVDQFPSLRARVAADPKAIYELYNHYENNTFGHMKPPGNEHAARLLAAALGK